MNKWKLPTALNIGAVDFSIRTDFRVILGIIRVLNGDEYDDSEKWEIALSAFYVDAEKIENIEEAIEGMMDFMACGGKESENDDKTRPTLMDWDQDWDILVPAINKVAGCDIRGLDHLHWWTFMSYYMEIGESTFSTVVGIRKKMAYGEKLEPYEKTIVRDNPKMVFLRDAERRRQDEADRAALAEIGL